MRLKERYAHGQGVTKYLARYVKGGPIADRRLCRVGSETVTFRYQDHRDGQPKRLTLSVGDFMGRVLWHLPEPHQHLVRTAGLYANRALARRQAIRTQLKQGREAVADSSLKDVVRVTYVLPDGSEFEQCWPVLHKYFGEKRPAAMMISADLLDRRIKIEIEVTALKRS